MKKWILILLAAPSLLWAQTTNGLSLAQVREQVLAGNPSVQESLERIVAAEATLRQAHSAYLPTISLNANYGHLDASMHPDAYPNMRVSDSFMQASSGIEANWLLFDGFAREARTLSAKLAVEHSRELADETRRLLILSCTVSYRQAQLARQSIEIAQQDLSFNQKLEADAQKRYAVGDIPEADVHNFSIRALQAENAMLQAQLEYSAACTVLAELMALPERKLADELELIEISLDGEAVVPELAEALQYALQHRPDYLALDSGMRILEQQVRAAKGDFAPRVSLVGDVGYTDRGDGFANVGQHGNYNSFVGVAVSWDVFSGGRKSAALKLSRAEMFALEQKQEALQLSIRSALSRRIDEAETARKIVGRQEQIRALSVKVRDSVEKSYRAGAEPITRLNEAQTNLVRAEGAYASAVIAYRLTLNQIEIETGRVLNDL